MTFFYDLNKRLKEVLEAPKSVNQKLNEGVKPDFLDVDKDGNKKESFKKAVADKKKHDVDEGMFDSLKAGMAKAGKVAKKVGGRALDTLGHGSDEELRKDLQRKIGVPATGQKPRSPIAKEEYGPLEEKWDVETKVNPEEKGKYAGKSKAELQKQYNALKSKGPHKKGTPGYGKMRELAFAIRAKSGWGEVAEEEDLNPFTNWKKPRAATPRTGEVTHGAKHDTEWTATGRKVTRRVDPQGMSVGSETDAEGNTIEKRGRGRPKGPAKAPERVTGKAYKHKGGRVTEQGQEELDEKAVSKKQQKFMGMVHAAQKGEKPASKEVAKVAKTMKKSDAEDFAATKHKGLPEKVKSKKKEESVEETASETPKASTSGKGLQYGKGIYDSLNREIENLISESMSINISSDSEGHKNITVTASDEDAVKLASVLKLAGLGGGNEGGCGCGQTPCACNSAEQVDENQPDWPTDEVESDDAFQYSGGLNKPKTTIAGDGQTTVPVTAVQVREESQEELDEQEQVMAPEGIDEAKEMCEVCEGTPCKCDESMAESLARFRSLAGIQEAAKPDYIDLDKDGDKKESMKKAAADKEKEAKKVDESIFKLTNLWKAYKG